MNEAHRDTIRRNIVALADDMDFDSVSTYLYSMRIFEKDHIEAFESKPNRKKKNFALLLDIETRGPEAFGHLVESLVVANQKHLAELLGFSSSEQPQGSTHADALNWNESNLGQPSSQPVLPSQNENSSNISTAMGTLPSHPQSDEVYKMSTKSRGKAFIINNKVFDELPLREGTDIDCENMDRIFRERGFTVTVKHNLKGKDIHDEINQLSREDHSRFDCLILTILSHGEEGTIHGTDSVQVKIEDTISLFSADQCPTLKGKPKIFFIQACRGDGFDPGVEAADGSGPAGEGRTKDDIEKEAHMLLQIVEGDSTDGLGSVKSKIPSNCDMLLGYSTVPGFRSWRNPEKGSWFIQGLTEVISEHANRMDLVSMMTMVNQRVACFKSDPERYRQASVFVSTLLKKLYFFPVH